MRKNTLKIISFEKEKISWNRKDQKMP